MDQTTSHFDPAHDTERAFVAALRARRAPPTPARWLVVALLVEAEDGAMRPDLLLYEPRNGWRVRRPMLETGLSNLLASSRDPGTFIAAACGDLRGDGQRSVVCGLSHESGRCVLLRFSLEHEDSPPELLAELGDEVGFIRSLAVGDVDGDGADEVVIGTRPNGQVLLLDFGPAALETVVLDEAAYGWQTTNTREVVIADADGDGRPEILATIARTDAEKWGETPGSVRLYSSSDGAWTRRIVDDFDGRSHSRMVAVGRLGTDLAPRIVANRVGVWRSEHDRIDPGSEMGVYRLAGPAVEKGVLASLDGAIKSRGFAIGDLDGDGMNELVVGTRALDLHGRGETSLLLFKWDALRGRWSSETLAKSGPQGFHCVAVADVDGDGRAEIVASDDGTGCIHLYDRRAAGWRRWALVETARRIFVVNIEVSD